MATIPVSTSTATILLLVLYRRKLTMKATVSWKGMFEGVHSMPLLVLLFYVENYQSPRLARMEQDLQALLDRKNCLEQELSSFALLGL